VPFPKKLLNEGETLELDLRPHWWYFAKNIVASVLLILLAAVVLAKLNYAVTQAALGILAIIWAGWLAVKYFQWTNTHFVVTSARVIFRTGALGKQASEIPLDRITNIRFRQSLWERIIGAGDIDIESAGRDAQSNFTDVWHPDGVQQEIYRQMEINGRKRAQWANPGAATATAPADQPSPSATPIPEQLKQLAELRDRGVITAAEFETKKTQLLDRM
jgi:uncharacterized membrane protein YdbT with pleckstrin-like domain